MTYQLQDALAAMARSRDAETASDILRLNGARFPKAAAALRLAYLRRRSELRNAGNSLEQDVWSSTELSCQVLGTTFNPQSRNPRQMPEMVRKHGAPEALRRLIAGQGRDGTSFFQKCVEAGDLTFTAEAICLRHADHFDAATREIARERLDRHPGLPR
jgi:hypothetical protein